MDQLPPGADLFNIPWVTPPPGQQSNFDEPSDLLTTFTVVVSIMISLMTIFGSLRIFTKLGRDERWRPEDWFSLFTMLFISAYGGILIAGCPKLAHYSWDVSLGFLIQPWPQKMLTTIAFMQCMCLLLGKLCLLLLYYRFFGHIKHVRYQIYTSTFLTLPILVFSIVFPILSAPPLGKPWGTPNPHNDSNRRSSLGLGVVNIVVDLMIFYIPIPVVARMNLKWKTKAGVLAIFLTGLIALVADMVVMNYRVQLYEGKDGLRAGMIVGLCSFVEAAISVICSSMPSAAKFYKGHIMSSQLFLSLRSIFHLSNGSSHSSLHEIHEVAKKESPKRIKGPYSIPTTDNFTAVEPSRVDGIELGDVPEGYLQPHSVIGTGSASGSIEPDRIQRDISWEQRSNTYSSGSAARNKDMV